jgi:hypothetical protein
MRYAALNHLRDARRRLIHERQAMEQLRINSESTVDWGQICCYIERSFCI